MLPSFLPRVPWACGLPVLCPSSHLPMMHPKSHPIANHLQRWVGSSTLRWNLPLTLCHHLVEFHDVFYLHGGHQWAEHWCSSCSITSALMARPVQGSTHAANLASLSHSLPLKYLPIPLLSCWRKLHWARALFNEHLNVDFAAFFHWSQRLRFLVCFSLPNLNVCCSFSPHASFIQTLTNHQLRRSRAHLLLHRSLESTS